MAGFNPGQAFLMATTRPKADPILGAPPIGLVQGQYGPNVAMNLGGVKNIVGNAGDKVMQFLNQLNQGGSDGAYRSDSERPGDFYNEFVPHPVTGEDVHPGVIRQWQRDEDRKFNRPMF